MTPSGATTVRMMRVQAREETVVRKKAWSQEEGPEVRLHLPPPGPSATSGTSGTCVAPTAPAAPPAAPVEGRAAPAEGDGQPHQGGAAGAETEGSRKREAEAELERPGGETAEAPTASSPSSASTLTPGHSDAPPRGPRAETRERRKEEADYVRKTGVFTELTEGEARVLEQKHRTLGTRWVDVDQSGHGEVPKYRSRWGAQEIRTDTQPRFHAGTPPMDGVRLLIRWIAAHVDGGERLMNFYVSKAYLQAQP